MTINGILHIALFFGVILALTRPLGAYIAMVFEGESRVSKRVFAPVENVIYRLFMVDARREMDWKRYAVSVVLFSAVGFLIVYAVLRLQSGLPWNPQEFPGTTSHLAFNTAASFTSNTNWQSYGGETTLSYFPQMVGLTVQNFVSAAVGICVLIALIRGFTRRQTSELGNFWADVTRCTLWILMPLAIIWTVLLVSQGVIQNLSSYKEVTTLEGAKQILAMGPAASQIAIKQLGTNGGGFFNVNSAMPFENPTPFSNFLEVVAIFLIPAALTYTFGKMVKDTKQGWAIFAAMSILFLAGAFVTYASEQRGNPNLTTIGANQDYRSGDLAQAGGNMEGKDVRFGIADSAIWAVATTDASNGSVNSMHDSYTPLGGLIPLFNMHLGEVVFGGVGSGLYVMLIFAIISVFVAGLMIGRTPEYLGKKMGPYEVKMAAIIFLIPSAAILILAAFGTTLDSGQAGPLNSGPHGYSEILYAYTSGGANNGSAFAGLTANTPYYNSTLGFEMLLGRFLPMVATLALAGALAKKQIVPASAATLPTNGPLFVGLLTGIVFIVGGLTFFPALALGPIVEHFIANTGALFKEGTNVTTEQRPSAIARERKAGISIFRGDIIRQAVLDSFAKLNPMHLLGNPVMLVVEIGAIVTTVLLVDGIVGTRPESQWFTAAVSLWLWFTVLFANFAEAMAEGRGKAQANTLRSMRRDTMAMREGPDGKLEEVSAATLRKGDVVRVEANQVVPSDGDVIEGVAFVSEAAITGESAPVLKEPGTDIRSSVTGGTTVTSDWLRIRITSDPGETFLDRMIALVEGASRQKTPNEIALNILLASFTIIFLLAVGTIRPFISFVGADVSTTSLVALLVCLIPTTIGGLLSAIGIAGMDRLVQHNVLAMSGRAVETAGDIDTLIMDKTGTITFGNRLATEFIPVGGYPLDRLINASLISSLADETPEGRSVVTLANGLGYNAAQVPEAEMVPFTAETRMSGIRINGHKIMKGAVDAVTALAPAGKIPADLQEHSNRISMAGGTPLAVADNDEILGLIYLKDTVKPGIRERLLEMRRAGIRTVMITGDNRLTAATIAEEAGVEDFVAEAKPEDKIRLIREEQALGRLVAMTGDGTNDAPALAQADVGVAMNSGTAAAKEAANMVDLDSDPTKLVDVVAIGKQLLMTRGALTTFSISNDVSKYFAIIPAMFFPIYPELDKLNIMRLASPESAILSAVIFNALIIIALVPLALKGVAYKAKPAAEVLRSNLAIYGLGGIIAPFIGIKAIDLILTVFGAT